MNQENQPIAEVKAARGEKGSEIRFPEMLTVAVSPHIKHKDTTRSLMLKVLIALMPALIYGIVYNFYCETIRGFNAIMLTVVSVVCCMFFEWGYQTFMKKPVTVTDLSAAVTGVLLAMNVSPILPVWQIVVGSAFAIIIVKQLFGGIGKNFLNPALAARVFMFLSYTSHMNSFDAVATATPLAELKQGAVEGLSVTDAFLGNTLGCIGETSALCLLIGGVYLLVSKVITWHIPVAYIGTVAVITFLFPVGGADRLTFMALELFTGGLMLGAVFMATDYVTSPVTPRGRLIYGVICGLITVLIRYFGGNAEGVSFSILIANLLVWYLDNITKPRRFGAKKEKRKEGKAE